MAEPVTIGWREWLELPDLDIGAIKAKVDTGTRSSSLHAFDVHEFEQDGTTMVRFKVHPLQRDSHHTVEAEAELVEHRLVRNPGAGGRAEVRPVIRTTVRLAGKRWPIEVTLTRRDAMGFRMLLGRQAVRRRFVVDPGRSFLASGAADARLEQEAGNDDRPPQPRGSRPGRSDAPPGTRGRGGRVPSRSLGKPLPHEDRHPVPQVGAVLHHAPRRGRGGARAPGAGARLPALLHEHHLATPGRAVRGEPLRFDAIIPRIGATYTFYGTAVVRQFEVKGVFAANGSVGISRSRESCGRCSSWHRPG